MVELAVRERLWPALPTLYTLPSARFTSPLRTKAKGKWTRVEAPCFCPSAASSP